jgi:hypothetical protein
MKVENCKLSFQANTSIRDADAIYRSRDVVLFIIFSLRYGRRELCRFFMLGLFQNAKALRQKPKIQIYFRIAPATSQSLIRLAGYVKHSRSASGFRMTFGGNWCLFSAVLTSRVDSSDSSELVEGRGLGRTDGQFFVQLSCQVKCIVVLLPPPPSKSYGANSILVFFVCLHLEARCRRGRIPVTRTFESFNFCRQVRLVLLFFSPEIKAVALL